MAFKMFNYKSSYLEEKKEAMKKGDVEAQGLYQVTKNVIGHFSAVSDS